jgi:hypothetical protein
MAEPVSASNESKVTYRIKGAVSRKKIAAVGNISGSVLWLIPIHFNKFLRIELILGNVD